MDRCKCFPFVCLVNELGWYPTRMRGNLFKAHIPQITPSKIKFSVFDPSAPRYAVKFSNFDTSHHPTSHPATQSFPGIDIPILSPQLEVKLTGDHGQEKTSRIDSLTLLLGIPSTS